MDTERELEVKKNLKNIADKIKEELPEGFGFALLTFEFNKEGQLMYISNADRLDIVRAMKEWIEKTESTYGNDTGKY